MFILLEGLLCLFDQGHDIAHAQNTGNNPVRVKRLKRIKLFSHSYKANGFASYPLDGKRRTPARVPIHFGQDHAINTDGIIKRFSDICRLLAHHRIRHKQHFVRLNRFLDPP